MCLGYRVIRFGSIIRSTSRENEGHGEGMILANLIDKIKSLFPYSCKSEVKIQCDHSSDETMPSIGDMVDEVCQWAMDGHPDELKLFLGTPKNELVKFHHCLGRNIRNHFHLWKYPWEPNLIHGVDHSPDHPDQISMKVIEEVHDRLMLA